MRTVWSFAMEFYWKVHMKSLQEKKEKKKPIDFNFGKQFKFVEIE
jgi:hypothetical protein